MKILYSGDTTDALDNNNNNNVGKTFSKIPLTVVKESEEEPHFQSSFENANQSTKIEQPSKVDDKIKPTPSKRVLDRNFEERFSLLMFPTLLL